MAVILYGIKNCDTVKKAKRYLDSQGIEYTFHDYRTDGIDEKMVNGFIKTLGWESVLNKRGTTWRKLDDSVKESTNEKNVAALLCENPAMIKRPILKHGAALTVGFSEEQYAEQLRSL